MILQYTTTNLTLDQVLEEYRAISYDELRKIVRSAIAELSDQIKADKKKAFNAVMGKVMSKVRGRVEGKVVAEIINQELQTLSE